MHRFLLGFLLLTTIACSSNQPEVAPNGGSSNGGSNTVAGNAASAGNQQTSGGTANGGSATAQAGGGSGSGSGSGGMATSAGAGGAAGAGAGGAAGTAGSSAGGASGGGTSHWVGTWACGPQTTEQANLPPSPGLAGNTLRQMVRVSIGGTQVRLRLSNEYGTSALSLSSVHVAVSKGGGAIDTATDKALSFSGMPAVTIATGQAVFSDPLDFALAPLSDLAISMHFTTQSGDVTGHPGSRTTSFLQTGDAVASASLASPAKAEHWYFITGLDVMADAASAAIVVLGDSITDGRGSTTDQNNRWPDILAKRLQANSATSKLGVLNMGIGGNTVLSAGLGPTATARFDHDVIQQSGVRWLIVLEGVNDLGGGADVSSSLIDAYKSFISKAHTANLRAYGVPILPIVGSSYASGESTRTKVNDWIRTSKTFDAVIDLDAAVRDPGSPTQLLPAYDSGDHLHLTPDGYKKMGEAVDLSLFGP
jgi:lysophospholipase L1-like esterase